MSFTLALSDAAGYADVSSFNLVFGGTNLSNACYLNYNSNTSTLSLWNDAGTATTYGTPGSSGALQNSQCSIDLANTTVNGSGTVLTFSVPITFAVGFQGAREMYSLGVNAANESTPWYDLGTWTVNVPQGSNPQISLDSNVGSGPQASGSAFSWTHTCTGSNRVLVVAMDIRSANGNNPAATSVTYNGVALTRIDRQADSVYQFFSEELW